MKPSQDSPSRQLLWELGRLSVNEQEQLYEQLDLHAEASESAHRRALAHAAAEHERIRLEAEREQQRLETARSLERERKDLEAERELHRLNTQRTQEKERFAREQAAQEAAAHAAEEERRRTQREREERQREEQERAAETQRRQDARQEELRQQNEEAEARAKQAVLANQAKISKLQSVPQVRPSQAPAQAQPQTYQTPTAAHGERRSDPEGENERYLAIWKRLKELRNLVKEHSKRDPNFKTAMGDGRRAIRKCIGQLVTDSANAQANRQPNVEIRNILRESHKFTTPAVPMANFLFAPPGDLPQSDIPALFLYLLNIFSKCLVSQFLGEVAIAPRTATTIGITGATIFWQADCQWHGHSLIDIFIAKYHRVCPVLFGIYGSDKNNAGRSRLGWWMDSGRFVTEQRHYERMTGLGAGFAAMTLRSYRNRPSPYPVWHYWQAASRILNVPRDQVTATHLVVLKAMIEGNEQRVLEFFGRAGLALLKLALNDFPASLPIRDGVAAKALLLLPDVLKTEKKLYL